MNTSNNCYLQLVFSGSTYYVDLDGDVPISLNFSVFDVRDISSKKTGNSKTIAIPGTKNNNKVFSNLWNINAANTTYNINQKVTCYVYANNKIVMRGYIQLLGVKKKSKSDSQGNQMVYYNAVIFDDANGFINSLGDTYLTDLNMSRFDHILTATTVFNPYRTYVSGFTYYQPWIPENEGLPIWDTPYYLEDYTPAIFAKTYIDQMFQEEGYTYSSSTFSSPIYESLVIPYNSEVVSGDNSQYLYTYKFSGSVTSYPLTYAGGNASPAAAQGGNYLTNIRFDQYVSGNSSTYDISYGTANPQYFGPEEINGKFVVQLALEAPYTQYLFGRAYVPGSGVNSEIADPYLQFTVNIYVGQISTNGGNLSSPSLLSAITVNTGAYQKTLFQRPQKTLTNLYVVSAGTNYIDEFELNVSSAFEQTPGKRYGIWAEAKYMKGLGNWSGWWTQSGSSAQPAGTIPKLKIRFGSASSSFASAVGTNTFIKNKSTTNYLPNSTVEVNQFRPQNIKKKDFFSSICQMLNLIIERDPYNERNLFIESRDVYYSGGTILDWSQKLDLNSDIDISLLAELQGSNRFDFKWFDDQNQDELLKDYITQNKVQYGEYIVNFDNNFLKNTPRNIQPIFTMTPTVYNVYNQAVPFIGPSLPKQNIRILSKYNGWIDGAFFFRDFTGGIMQPFYKTQYVWAGEFDHPYVPNWSLNWGTNQDIYYNSISYIPNGNLYNNYYLNYVNQIASGKVLKAKFYLTNSDISNLRLNSKIWLDQTKCYFIINKIVDFNPVEPGLTTVELMRFDT